MAALVLWVGSAAAGNRKRVVVLDFDGPKADKFHDDIVKLIKKSHTVVSTEKWNGAAEELDAGKVTEKNVKKVAKKLKVDGVVTGKIEKRRDEYIIRIKLRAGTTGELTGNTIDTKADGPRLDGQAQRDVKDELIAAIDGLESNHGGSMGADDEADDKPAKTKKDDKKDDDEGAAASDDDAKSKKKKKGFGGSDMMKSDDDASASSEDSMTSKKDKKKDKKDKAEEPKKDDADTRSALSTKHDDDESPLGKSKKDDAAAASDDDSGSHKKKKKKVAAKSDDDGGDVEATTEPVATDAATRLSPANRAVDASAGVSLTARRLGFSYSSSLGKVPPGYKQTLPVAGAMFDATVYPLAIPHKSDGIVNGLGIHLLYDKVLLINSKKNYQDSMGTPMSASLFTVEGRFGVGAVFRYPLGHQATSIVVGGKFDYINQQFEIQQTVPGTNIATDIPNVHYSILSPGAFLRYPMNAKINLGVDLAYLAVTNAGPIQTPQQYGAASVSGFEGSVGGDYALTHNVFLRAAIRVETIGFSFKGDPASQTNTRDNDSTTQDVFGARDTYFGGTITLGYLY